MAQATTSIGGIRKCLVLSVALMAMVVSSNAQRSLYSGQKSLYNAKESSFDLFGSYVAAEHGVSHVLETSIRDGSFGGGIGMNYFASQKLGFGMDAVMSANGGSFIDSTSMSLLGRLPLGQSGVAPYLLAGGGRAYEPSVQWIGQAGVGLELRTEKTLGLFVDGRYVWGEHSGTDRVVLRGGLRLVF
jgi:hypothetical protein